ncbi:MAG: flotillin family protein [Deltaproteobacteria bacterium]|nr:flotillin family protein [Deltaproteobacteria bacterium]
MLESVLSITCLGVAGGVLLLLGLMLLRAFLYIARPNEVLVISGRGATGVSGEKRAFQAVFMGRVWRKPFLEKVDRMDLTTNPVEIVTTNAYSKGGIPLTVHAVANVKVTSDPALVMNAVERFLGRDVAEIQRVAKETLEGHLRGVLARLTPEEVNEDRLKFADNLVDESEVDFDKLGLHLDTLKILNVSDDVKYLDSIGRQRIANVIRDAEIAESDARADAERAEAAANQQGRVADETSETAIVRQANSLRQFKGEQEARAASEEERTIQMVSQARAEAEVALQEIRQKVEQTRLLAEVVLPAQARQQADSLHARAQAAPIAENGRALAETLALLTATWKKAGSDAKDVFLIQQLEKVLAMVAARVQEVEVGEVVLLDDGDGTALPSYVAAYPATVTRILKEIREATGIDVPGALTRREVT